MAGSEILIVEDDAVSATALAELLAGAGYRTRCAADGASALAMLAAGDRPAAILVDGDLARLGGAAFRRRQGADARIADIPVVLLSGGAGVERTARAIGVAAVVHKPVDFDELSRALADLLGPAAPVPPARPASRSRPPGAGASSTPLPGRRHRQPPKR